MRLSIKQNTQCATTVLPIPRQPFESALLLAFLHDHSGLVRLIHTPSPICAGAVEPPCGWEKLQCETVSDHLRAKPRALPHPHHSTPFVSSRSPTRNGNCC